MYVKNSKEEIDSHIYVCVEIFLNAIDIQNMYQMKNPSIIPYLRQENRRQTQDNRQKPKTSV